MAMGKLSIVMALCATKVSLKTAFHMDGGNLTTKKDDKSKDSLSVE